MSNITRMVNAYHAGETLRIDRHCTNDSKGEYCMRISCSINGKTVVLIGYDAEKVLKEINE